MATIDISGLQALRAKVDAARTQMREDAKVLVKDGAAAIFEEYGDIVERFGWSQYTPYFNDGEPCEFRVGKLFIFAQEDVKKAKEEYGSDWEYEHANENEWYYCGSDAFGGYGGGESKVPSKYGSPNPNVDNRYVEAQQACEAIYQIFEVDESMAKDIFNDHVTVIFTADGVEVEEYDHE